MHLTGITVCIGFDDFLAETLPRNRHLFNQFVIVTSPEDTETQRLAKANRCKLVITKRHRQNGPFNKGAAINDGIDNANRRQWLCHLDADIVLPDVFRQWILDARQHVKHGRHLDEHIIGMHRHNCRSRAEWLEYLRTGTHAWPVEKLRKFDQIPVGFLQIWNAAVMDVRYPEHCPTASMSDLLFGEQFLFRFHPDQPRCIHLENKHRQDLDYAGRRSPRWK